MQCDASTSGHSVDRLHHVASQPAYVVYSVLEQFAWLQTLPLERGRPLCCVTWVRSLASHNLSSSAKWGASSPFPGAGIR